MINTQNHGEMYDCDQSTIARQSMKKTNLLQFMVFFRARAENFSVSMQEGAYSNTVTVTATCAESNFPTAGDGTAGNPCLYREIYVDLIPVLALY